MKSSLDLPGPRRGRPRKFGAPARALTLTLPEDVIGILRAIDADLSRAVVRLVEPQRATVPHKAAELSRFGRHAVIVVNPTPTLRDRTGVELVPLPDGRALISFAQPMSIAELELMIDDALEEPALTPEDRRIFEAIADILKTARRSKDVQLRQRNIIVLEGHARHPRTDAGSRRSKTRRSV